MHDDPSWQAPTPPAPPDWTYDDVQAAAAALWASKYAASSIVRIAVHGHDWDAIANGWVCWGCGERRLQRIQPPSVTRDWRICGIPLSPRGLIPPGCIRLVYGDGRGHHDYILPSGTDRGVNSTVAFDASRAAIITPRPRGTLAGDGDHLHREVGKLTVAIRVDARRLRRAFERAAADAARRIRR